jgi:hypothetical protein
VVGSCDEDERRERVQGSTERYIEGRRPNGRPQNERLHAMDSDAKRMLKCGNWRRSTEDRDIWRRRIEEAKAQVGLQGH